MKMAQQPASEVIAGWRLGTTSMQYETGGRGVNTISTGRGDNGGASYGAYQLSSKKGTLERYLKDPNYGDYSTHFSDLVPGTKAFNDKWSELAKNDPNFASTQHQFIHDTHYKVQLNCLKAAGIDLSGRGVAVQDMIWSTSVHFGGSTSLISNALHKKFGPNLSLESRSDAEIIVAVQDHKIANNEAMFRSSSEEIRRGNLARATSEKQSLLNLLGIEDDAKKNLAPQIAPDPHEKDVEQAEKAAEKAVATNESTVTSISNEEKADALSNISARELRPESNPSAVAHTDSNDSEIHSPTRSVRRHR